MKILLRLNILLMFFILSPIGAQSLIYLNINDLAKVKNEISTGGKCTEEINTLVEISQMLKDDFPFTITKFKSPLSSKGLHEYFSDSPYWWPVKGDSALPYIRHDGVRNPDRFMKHKEELQNFYKTIVALSFSAYFTDNDEYAETARKLLKVWFVDDSTKMNPNLKYAQMIRNRSRRRGVGIIEGRRFALMTDAINLLRISGRMDDKLYSEIQKWYKDFYIWLTESYYGLDEKKRGNNHSTWWGMQTASIADFLGYKDDVKELGEYSKHFLLDNQFDSTARQPLEEARTKSLSYSFFNVRAHSYFNAALMNEGINNWNYINKNGVKLTDAINYLLPFLENPEKWELKQITEIDNSSPLFLAVSGLKLKNIEYLKVYSNLSRYNSKKILKESFDPMQIVFDILINNKLEKNGNKN